MSQLKVVTISATFPALPASRAVQSGRGRGSNLRIAAQRAVANLFRQPQLKGRRIEGFTAVVNVGTEEVTIA